MSVVGTQLGDDDVGPAAGVLVGFLLIALLASVVAVFPKFRSRRDVASGTYNPLFFGHFAALTKDEFLERLSDVLDQPGTSYRAIAVDLYDKGYYLVTAKYRYLRISYIAFLLGFVLAATTYGATSIG